MKRLALIIFVLLSSPAWAAISYVGSCSGTTSCASVPAHQAGDLFIAYAGRDASTTASTNPSGWTSVGTQSINGTSTAKSVVRVSCKIAASASETATGFTNAGALEVQIYRGTDITGSGTCGALGTPSFFATAINTTSTTETFNTVTNGASSSWDAGFGYAPAATAGMSTAPTNMINRGVSGTIMGGHDVGPVAGFTTASVTTTTAGRIITAVVEIKAEPPPPSACSSGPCPTLVQDATWGTNNGTETGNGFKYHLPNASLGGSSTQGNTSNNLVICGISWEGAAVTATISDNNTNTWTAGPTCNDGTRNVAIRYAMGAKPGTQDITLTLSSAAYNVHLRCSEFYNVATSSAVDGTASCTNSTSNFGPTIAAGSITTTVDNDLIYHYGIDDAALCCTNPVTSFVVGGGFNLLPSDRHLGHFAQYFAWGSHGAINPTMTANQSSNDAFGSAAIALKAASAGTAPGSGIRIVRELHLNNAASSADFTFQWPCSGNLTVFSQGESNVYHTVTSVTDSDSNSFTLVSRSSGEPYMYYAAPMTCNSPNNRTMVVHGNVGGSTASDVIYDIANAATSPYDTRASGLVNQSNAGGTTCVIGSPDSSTDHNPDITPTAAPGIAIAVAEEGTGPRCDLYGSGYIADMGWYAGATDNSVLLDNGNGYGHYYYSNTSTLDFHWLWANGTTSGGYALAVTFKAPAAASGVRKRIIVTSE
ncbi:MAG: hypothetical protein ACHP9S_08425 [Terriglobales bacterium]